MLWIGIFFFALMVLFSILTLPIEIDASRRGTKLLQEAGLMQNQNDASDARLLHRRPENRTWKLLRPRELQLDAGRVEFDPSNLIAKGNNVGYNAHRAGIT